MLRSLLRKEENSRKSKSFINNNGNYKKKESKLEEKTRGEDGPSTEVSPAALKQNRYKKGEKRDNIERKDIRKGRKAIQRKEDINRKNIFSSTLTGIKGNLPKIGVKYARPRKRFEKGGIITPNLGGKVILLLLIVRAADFLGGIGLWERRGVPLKVTLKKKKNCYPKTLRTLGTVAQRGQFLRKKGYKGKTTSSRQFRVYEKVKSGEERSGGGMKKLGSGKK